MKNHFLLLSLLLMPIQAGLAQDDTLIPPSTPNASGLALYRTLTGHREFLPDDGNLLLSPASVESVLRVLRLGARGRTADELDRLLVPRPGSAGVRPAGAEELLEGAALWVENGWPLLPGFQEALKTEGEFLSHSADFSGDPDAETGRINDWVKERSAGRIGELFAPSDLRSDTRLVIASVLAYEGAWSQPFDESHTKPGTFRMGRKKKAQTDFMHLVGEHATVAREDGTRVVSLSLQEGRQRCVLILPPDGKDPLAALLALEKSLTPSTYRELTADLADANIDLKMPRLDMRVRSSLKAALQLTDAGSMFAARTADFSGMSEESGLCVSVLRHEVCLTLDEKGARGAAATGAAMATRGWPKKPVPVAFDRPFLFSIEEVDSGRILFLGRLVTPLQ